MATRSPAAKAKDAAYEAQPEQKKKRAARNAARREMEAKGVVHKGDGLDIDHKVPLNDGINNDPSNLRVRSPHTNRGWRKGKSRNTL